jgi:para-aminobenzoate synthetase
VQKNQAFTSIAFPPPILLLHAHDRSALPVLIIDNYDSFTFNLVSLVAIVTGETPTVIRNDEMTWEQIAALDFTSVIISPGPGRPDRVRDFGVSGDVIRNATVPILGVCLGHQGIAAAFGGIVAQTAPVHGYPSEIIHDGDDLFRGIPEQFSAIRYHSLAVTEPLPQELRKIAWTPDGMVMALRHISRPLWGVQFHPESVCTEYGEQLVRNFLSFAATSINIEVRSIPLRHAPGDLFRGLFAQEQHSFWLDSSLITDRSRFSYMGASNEVYQGRAGDGVFDWLQRSLVQTRVQAPPVPFPFTGGYVGYFGYELKAECGAINKRQSAMPDCVLLRVERFLVIDHTENTLYIVGQWPGDIESRIVGLTLNHSANPAGIKPVARYHVSRDAYLDRIRECLSFITAGESYEICLTNKVLLESGIAALDYYETLRRTNPAPYSAYLKLGDIEVASSSPECFLRIDRDRRAESRPIKGTIRRGRDAEEDAKLRDLLAHDARFRAENLMIVDLVRNDLARVCVPGSVHVPALMEVETYETLHQLVSTISGQLAPEATTVDCLRALFPGGSMTGAPKLRTMELLDNLEPEARGIYSGSIGYLGFNGTADLSIVIRTAVFRGGQVSFGAGGAIVAQSDPEAEWDEMELKAQALLRAFALT